MTSRDHVRRRVAAGLRAALMAGEFAPDSVHSAPSLAARFGVSATPVREAMLDLARDGLVEVVPNTGYRITVVTSEELDHLAEVRLLLEVPVMGEIAASHSPEDAEQIAALRSVVEEMETAERQGDITAYLLADTEFHTAFLALHGNPELVAVVRGARERGRLRGLHPLAAEGRLGVFTQEHRGMIDLALARDREGLEHLVRQHIQHVRNEWADDARPPHPGLGRLPG